MKSQHRIISICALACWFLLPHRTAWAADPIKYVGGDGSSLEKAVVIEGGNEQTGVRAEYVYLAKHFPGYHPGSQAELAHNHRHYDKLDFTTSKGEKKTIFFDITGFFGKLD